MRNFIKNKFSKLKLTHNITPDKYREDRALVAYNTIWERVTYLKNMYVPNV